VVLKHTKGKMKKFRNIMTRVVGKKTRSLKDEEDGDDDDECKDYENNWGSCSNCRGIGLEGHECEDCEDTAMFYVGEVDSGL